MVDVRGQRCIRNRRGPLDGSVESGVRWKESPEPGVVRGQSEVGKPLDGRSVRRRKELERDSSDLHDGAAVCDPRRCRIERPPGQRARKGGRFTGSRGRRVAQPRLHRFHLDKQRPCAELHAKPAARRHGEGRVPRDVQHNFSALHAESGEGHHDLGAGAEQNHRVRLR